MSSTATPPQRDRAPAASRRGSARARRRGPSSRLLPSLLLLLFALVFAVKIANYVFPEQIRFPRAGAFFTRLYDGAESWYVNNPSFHSCPGGLAMFTVPDGYVCAPAGGANDHPSQVNARIFEHYPLDGGVREAMYASTRTGIASQGKDLMRGMVDVPRYRPVGISSTERWSADPYKAVYWRLYYYSLRPTVNLLAAFKETGDRRYAQRLIAIDQSFFRQEASSRWAWADDHAVAFRAFVLAYEWWELRRLHVLTLAQSAQFLTEIERTGAFLLDRNHYQPEMNHGTNESAALLELAVDFPSLPGAQTWLRTARLRVSESLHLLLDADGQLIENSPYYHFYELDKYWQIYQFSLKTQTPIASDFRSRLDDMVRYGTYILQPDGSVPLLGASLAQTLHYHGTYQTIAERYPEFKYVLTGGAGGKRPSDVSRFFPASGRTVFRSGWGSGTSFRNQAYMTFNVGKYRTDHSHLDALGFTLYDNGETLLPAPGLYTYAYNRMREYFHGTSAHNTVVVDGRDQEQGDAYAGPLMHRDGVTWQSGESSLYEGVDHQRTLMMLDKDHVLVIDRLHSSTPHTYQQMFHLFPGARLQRRGLTAIGRDGAPSHTLRVTQLDQRGIGLHATIGQVNPPAGLCSRHYQVLLGCWAVAYTRRADDASYTTLLSVGKPDPRFRISYDRARSSLTVHDDGRVLHLTLGESPGRKQSVSATHPKAPVAHATPLPGTVAPSHWQASGDGTARTVTASDHGRARAVEMTAGDRQVESMTDPFVHASLATANLQLRIKVTNAPRLRSLTLGLSNRGAGTGASIELSDSYSRYYSGDWMTVTLGREAHTLALNGHWELHHGFRWDTIDAVRLTMQSRPGRGPAPTVSLAAISSVPQPRSGAVALVFDDGYESVLPAAAAMHARGIAGTIAVIGKYAELPFFKYMTLYELRMLQNRWGWNMVNHTQDHVDAVADYYRRGALGAYEQDILANAVFLQHAGLNSAPNWLIYPHGTTNTALDRVVSRFYTFARTTDSGPEAFPYGSPLRVKTIELRSPTDGGDGGGTTTLTAPSLVLSAVRDALRFHTTLILTMHRIRGIPSDRQGYPLADFVQILDGLKRLHAPVLTLSALDKMDGVPETGRIKVTPTIPSLITVSISQTRAPSAPWSPPPWITIALTLAACAATAIARRHRIAPTAQPREPDRTGVG